MTDCEKALWERALVEAEKVNWVRPHRRKQAIARALLKAKAEALAECAAYLNIPFEKARDLGMGNVTADDAQHFLYIAEEYRRARRRGGRDEAA